MPKKTILYIPSSQLKHGGDSDDDDDSNLEFQKAFAASDDEFSSSSDSEEDLDGDDELSGFKRFWNLLMHSNIFANLLLLHIEGIQRNKRGKREKSLRELQVKCKLFEEGQGT